jgi:hypothetical protein
MRENYVWNAEKLMDSWEVETSTENREATNPFVISLEGITGGENNSDDWPVLLE